jgi:hypothetical protein
MPVALGVNELVAVEQYAVVSELKFIENALHVTGVVKLPKPYPLPEFVPRRLSTEIAPEAGILPPIAEIEPE